MIKLSKVRPYQQKTKRTCSAACLHAVLRHYGFEVPEETLSELIGVRRHGAELYQIVGVARALGFKASQVEIVSMKGALEYTRRDLPLICDVQSWTKPGSGHYVVLVDIKGGRAEIMDPNVAGNWRSMPVKDFDERWWDGDNVYPYKTLRRAAVFIEPRRRG